MKKLFIILLILIPFLFPVPALARHYQRNHTASEQGQVIIKFKPKVSPSLINKILQKYDMHLVEKIDALSALIVSVPVGQETTIIDKLKKENAILYAEPNYLYTYESLPPLKTNRQSVIDDIHVKKAWTVSKGKKVNVAIIDSGFDINHPAFAEKVGYVKNYSKDPDLTDRIGHGTRTTGIIAARNTPQGITGICPDCSLILVKLGEDPNSRNVAKGIVWAAQKGAKVINISIATEGYSHLTEEAVNYAWEKGAVIVAAAGNQHSSQKIYPGGYHHVLAVAALDESNNKATFSNYGPWVAMAAPGVNVYTTHNNETYGYVSGTSISSPIVAGVAALVWGSKYGTSNQAVRERLCDTADKIKETSVYWRCGLIDAGAALTAPSHTTVHFFQHLLRYINR